MSHSLLNIYVLLVFFSVNRCLSFALRNEENELRSPSDGIFVCLFFFHFSFIHMIEHVLLIFLIIDCLRPN